MRNRVRSGRLVYVGEDGDLYQSDEQRGLRRLTWGWKDSGDDDRRLEYVWPSYSPDGSLVACFGVRPGESPEAGLYAVADDGVAMHELWRMAGAAPVCESWSPDSGQIALLLQEEEGSRLELADVRDPGRTTTLDRGAPVFWSWSPAAGYIAVHTGGSRTLSEDARLSVFATEDGCREVVRLTPGEFRTPAWSPDGTRVAYVDASNERKEYLSFYRVADGVSEIVCPVEGHCAMLWSPDGRYLAFSEALGETPYLFTGVTLVDTRTGRSEVVGDESVVAFLWSPCSNRLLLMAFSEDGGMQWSTLDVGGGRTTVTPRFFPSRELVYFCWFFDQFAPSHPLVSPDGRMLAFTGSLPDSERDESGQFESSVYLASLTGDGPLRKLAPGHFACWDGGGR